ncbi:plasmid partitioning protein RepB C-terminal domain-containing protein [Dyella sp.]|uniref:plasmid partitioning protein RepB C-terminal domain-containing protein n=1 Tax=Dyella sp. TaxID=1869338 RepID=UPI0028426693|nr:plasmid partitioning protein RepB C-terminal domain-containing protein [Dyella sp.]MDR3445402.1 plasmid partitioning protein RepB C-terminal domain-containing protein [Dyella sp.]
MTKERDGNKPFGGKPPKSAFEGRCRRVKVDELVALKTIKQSVLDSMKYQQIRASVKEVGLVEPPVITPVKGKSQGYYVVDGHLRVAVLKELGIQEVDCLVSDDDDTYTYNKKVNRLAAVQDHKMIARAIEQGVSAERLAKSLGLAEETIKLKFRLLNGICPEAAELLANVNCPAKVFEMLRQMKPVRQMEAAELMVGQKNFTVQFAMALLASSTPEQLTDKGRARESSAVSVESMARVERELASLQTQISAIEDSYGPDVLHLTIVKGYLTKILENAAVVKWLASNQPEYLREFQRIADMDDLSGM